MFRDDPQPGCLYPLANKNSTRTDNLAVCHGHLALVHLGAEVLGSSWMKVPGLEIYIARQVLDRLSPKLGPSVAIGRGFF